MTVIKIETAARTQLQRISSDRPEIVLSQAVVRFIEGPQGAPGAPGVPGTPGADGAPGDPGDGTLDGVPVELAGIQVGDFLTYDPLTGKIVNAPIAILNGGAF